MRPVPRVSTRGYYDLRTGAALKSRRYHLYPKRDIDALAGSAELVVVVHGLRNDSAGAAEKARLAQARLRKLGYRHPVIGFSYDSNTTGAHLASSARRALAAGQRIARANGRHLAWFVADFKESSPGTRIRLVGHSLGSQVIQSALERLYRRRDGAGIIESAHLFGASIPAAVPSSPAFARVLGRVVRKKITNYYAPTDAVLAGADEGGLVRAPLGLHGAAGRTPAGYVQRRVRPANHRFASYAAVLGSFP